MAKKSTRGIRTDVTDHTMEAQPWRNSGQSIPTGIGGLITCKSNRNPVSKWQGSSHRAGLHEQDTNTLERKLLRIKTSVPRNIALREVSRIKNKKEDQIGHPDVYMMEVNRVQWRKALGMMKE